MLQAHNLTFTLMKRNFIQNITLDFQTGKLYGIVGPNGSGKSTLLKTLAGIWMPTAGNVLWSGENLLKQERKAISQTISLVPQNPQSHFDFLVIDFVAMGRYPHQDKKNNPTKSNEIVEHSLKTVNVWHLRDRLITQLSSGERQRVYIARALATESPVLLLDEPTASLDIRHQLEIWHVLKKLTSQGKLVIVTLHDLPAAGRFCDEIVVLNHGENIAKGLYSEVMQPALMEQVFGLCNDEALSFVLKDISCC